MWLDGVVELLFPARCAACDVPGNVLCDACRDRLPLIRSAQSCFRCGAPIPAGHIGCAECTGREFAFEAARCVGLLQPPLSSLVTVYKDGGERRLVPVIGELLADRLGEWIEWTDEFVPVPPRPSSASTRGFDHMMHIARGVSMRTGVPCRQLLTARETQDQRKLGRDDRLANAAGRYAVLPGAQALSRVVLIDDVFTTGATLDACAGALLRAGADAVRVLALARASDVADGRGRAEDAATC